jgi:hypothetical protein
MFVQDDLLQQRRPGGETTAVTVSKQNPGVRRLI